MRNSLLALSLVLSACSFNYSSSKDTFITNADPSQNPQTFHKFDLTVEHLVPPNRVYVPFHRLAFFDPIASRDENLHISILGYTLEKDMSDEMKTKVATAFREVAKSFQKDPVTQTNKISIDDKVLRQFVICSTEQMAWIAREKHNGKERTYLIGGDGKLESSFCISKIQLKMPKGTELHPL